MVVVVVVIVRSWLWRVVSGGVHGGNSRVGCFGLGWSGGGVGWVVVGDNHVLLKY